MSKESEIRQWVINEFDREPVPDVEEAMDKLFASERGCTAVFVALICLRHSANEHDDEDGEGECFHVIDILARARLLYLEEHGPTE